MKRHKLTLLTFFAQLVFLNINAQVTLNGSIEAGHVFNDIYYAGYVINSPELKKWKKHTFNFSPLAGLHGHLKYHGLKFSMGIQYQRNGRFYKEINKDFTDDFFKVKTYSSITEKYTGSKICFPVSIGFTGRKKGNSEVLFIGFRTAYNLKSEYVSAENIQSEKVDFAQTLTFNLLEDNVLGKKNAKVNGQFFAGFSFPENSYFSINIVGYVGKVYQLDDIRYQYHNYDAKYSNIDIVLSVRYNFVKGGKK